MIGMGIAMIIGAMLPLAIVYALTKGAGKMVQAQSSRYIIGQITTKIANSEITNGFRARSVGLMEEEWKAIAASTRGVFKVFRGAKPQPRSRHRARRRH